MLTTLQWPSLVRLRRLVPAAAASQVRFNSSASTPEDDNKSEKVKGIVNHAYKYQKPRSGPVAAEMYSSLKSTTNTVQWRPFNSQPLGWIKPHDFTYKARIAAPRRPRARPLVAPCSALAKRDDVFYQLNIDPTREMFNTALLSAYVSDMGRIQNRTHTRLTSKSQRKLGRAIRRAKMMGVIPWLTNAARNWTNQRDF